MEAHSIGGVLACGDFKIVGVSPSEDLAKCFALQAILEKAVTHGILQLGCDLHVFGKCGLESGFRHDQILRACGVVVEEGARVPIRYDHLLWGSGTVQLAVLLPAELKVPLSFGTRTYWGKVTTPLRANLKGERGGLHFFSTTLMISENESIPPRRFSSITSSKKKRLAEHTPYHTQLGRQETPNGDTFVTLGQHNGSSCYKAKRARGKESSKTKSVLPSRRYMTQKKRHFK